jgi:hypothetical protein
VGDQEDLSRILEGPADLTDVIAIAILMASRGDDSGLEAELEGLPAAGRLGLDETKTRAVMHESAAEVAALSQALGA